MQEHSSFDHDVDMPYSGTPNISARRKSYFNEYAVRRKSLTTASSVVANDEFPEAASYCQTNNRYDQIEDLSYDNVDLQVYMYYAEALGIGHICIAMLFYIAYQAFEVASKLWLSEWASTKSHKEIKGTKNIIHMSYLNCNYYANAFQLQYIMYDCLFL